MFDKFRSGFLNGDFEGLRERIDYPFWSKTIYNLLEEVHQACQNLKLEVAYRKLFRVAESVGVAALSETEYLWAEEGDLRAEIDPRIQVYELNEDAEIIGRTTITRSGQVKFAKLSPADEVQVSGSLGLEPSQSQLELDQTRMITAALEAANSANPQVHD